MNAIQDSGRTRLVKIIANYAQWVIILILQVQIYAKNVNLEVSWTRLELLLASLVARAHINEIQEKWNVYFVMLVRIKT